MQTVKHIKAALNFNTVPQPEGTDLGTSQIRMELSSVRSLFSFGIKLKAANRATPHSSGDPSQDSFVVAVWQLTSHQPNESSERGKEFQEQMAVCRYVHILVCMYVLVCVYLYIYTHSKYVYILYVYKHTDMIEPDMI